MLCLGAAWPVQAEPIAALVPGEVDSGFRPVLDGPVTHLVRQADGKILVAGRFTTVNGVPQEFLARFNAHGSLDTGFRPRLSGAIRALGVGTDGRVVVAGDFSVVSGVTRRFIARLEADGTLDESFDAGDGLAVAPPGYVGSVNVRAVLVQNDGKVVIGGVMQVVHGVANRGFARLNSDGSLDTSFNHGGGLGTNGMDSEVNALLQQEDGRILIAGSFASYRGLPTPSLVRIHPNGDPDTDFVAQLPQLHWITGLRLDPTGRLIVVTSTTVAAGEITRRGAARLNEDGTLDASFDPLGVLPTEYLLQSGPVQPDGKIYIHSYASDTVTRLNPDGSFDEEFARLPGFDRGVTAAELDQAGRLWVGGTFTNAQGVPQPYLARVGTGATPPRTDLLEFSSSLFAVTEDAGQWRVTVRRRGLGTQAASVSYRVLSDAATAGVDFRAENGTLQWAAGDWEDKSIPIAILDDSVVEGDETFVVELTEAQGAALDAASVVGVTIHDNECPASILDAGFSQGVTLSAGLPAVYALAVQDDHVLVGGSFDAIAGVPRLSLARLEADGSLDGNFVADVEGRVDAVVVASDGRIVIGGTFGRVNQAASKNVARLWPDGTVDDSFSAQLPSGVSTYLTALMLDRQGRVLVGGGFQVEWPLSGSGIFLSRLQSNGQRDPSFTPPFLGQGGVRALREQSDGRILVLAQGPRLARLNANGSVDATFSLPAPLDEPGYTLTAMALLPDDRIILAASAPKLNESTVLRLQPDGSLDSSYHIPLVRGPGYQSVVLAIHVQPDGKAVLGGNFKSVDGRPALGLARLNEDGALDVEFGQGQGLTHDSGLIYAWAGQSDGRLIAGGMFTEFNGLPRMGLAQLTPWTVGLNTLELTAARFVSGEASGPAQITVRRCGDSSLPVTAMLTVTGGNAAAGVDYLPASPQIQFAPLEVHKTVALELLDDTTMEPDEAIELALSAPGGDVRLGPQGTTAVTILDDDLPASNVDERVRTRWIFQASQEDGKLLVSSSNSLWRLAQLEPITVDGTFQPIFTRQGDDRPGFIVRVLLQPDGKVLVGGDFAAPGPGLARANPDGSLDEAFLANLQAGQVSAYAGVHGLALQSDGMILLTGESLLTAVGQGVARLHVDGQLDTSFAVQATLSPGGFNDSSVAVQSDGKILLGGNLHGVNGVARNGLARLNADGSLDVEFAPVVTGGHFNTAGVKAILVQPDGRIVIGGDFATVNGLPRRNVARLNQDGSVDTSFQTGEGADGLVNALAWQPDGRLVLGGEFTHLQGTRRVVVGRLNANGSLDPGFAPGQVAPYSVVLNLGQQPDGALLLGGRFCQLPLDTYECEDAWDDCDPDTCLGTIRLLPNPPPQFVRVQTPTPGAVQLWLRGTPGRSYRIEASWNLIDWSPRSTQVATEDVLEFVDSAPGTPQFYRAVEVP